MLLRLTYRRDGEGDCACVAAGIGGIFIGAITVRLYLRNLASISGRREFSLFYTNVRLKILENFQKACEKIEKNLTYIYEGKMIRFSFLQKREQGGAKNGAQISDEAEGRDCGSITLAQ